MNKTEKQQTNGSLEPKSVQELWMHQYTHWIEFRNELE